MTWRGNVFIVFCLVITLANVSHQKLDQIYQDQIEATRPAVDSIIKHIIHGAGKGQTFNRLAELGDRFGSRMSGSKSLEDAIDYSKRVMELEGFVNVSKEPVMVPRWTRGKEWGQISVPMWDAPRPMMLLALGTSVGTNGTNLTAEVIVVRSFEELGRLSNDTIKDKIVVYNQPWTNYGTSGSYRRLGAIEASKRGAIATLIRSVTQLSIYSPHTGVQDNEENGRRIPAACITVEDAELLQRLQDKYNETITVTIYMEAENHPDSESFNLVGEILGSTRPNETVIFGGHFDTWDVTDGSMDDGGGVMMAWEALSVINKLKLTPKRTMRLVLWTSEEYGLIGGEAYYRTHNTTQVKTLSLIMQADGGSFRPQGIRFSGSGLARSIMEAIMEPLAEINATTVFNGGGASSDTGWWVTAGVPGVELLNSNENYFYYHHTAGDAMTVLDSDDLDRCTAVWAVAAYTVACLDDILPRGGDYVGSAVSPSLHFVWTIISCFVSMCIFNVNH